MERKNSRRRFFIHLGQMLGLAAFASAWYGSKVFAEEKRRARTTEAGGAGGADAELSMVEPGKGTAVPVNYHLIKSLKTTSWAEQLGRAKHGAKSYLHWFSAVQF